jgi:hypothetical protein
MENENKIPGDAGFTPDTDSKSDSQNNNGSTEEKQSQTTVSPRKLQANRENAKKSTGPTTPRGKRYSSFNALKHGLLARKVMFAPDGKLLDAGLQRLFESLHDRYSTGDLGDELLLELAVTDYWRLQKAMEYERKSDYPFNPILLRYVSTNRRALDKSLQLLRELPANEETTGETEDGDSTEATDLEQGAEIENDLRKAPAAADVDISGDEEGKASA